MKPDRLIAILAVAAIVVAGLAYFDQDGALKTEITAAPFGKVNIVRFGGKARNFIIYLSDSKG